MRILILTPALLLFAATGCATSDSSNYNSEMKRLSDACAARGGILSPTRYETGRPQTDNVCKIAGGASPLTSGDQPR